MKSEDSKKSRLEEYIELSKNSLIRVQYSCGGNSTDIDEAELIPIVSGEFTPENKVTCTFAREEDVEAIVELLKTNDLPVSDLGAGQRIFMVALLNEKVVGCVAVEIYGDIGLLRSLAVNTEHRRNGIGMKLVAEAETWSYDKGIKCLYLLTTTAVGFFSKLGWANTERTKVPLSVLHSPEFASICPTTAICLSKSFVV